MLPSPHAEPERYQGRPLLIILENYVLACIGALTAEADSSMAGVVKMAFGGDVDWRKTVRHALELDDSIDESLRTIWVRNQEVARNQQVELHPIQFAKMLVDQNFAHLIERQ